MNILETVGLKGDGKVMEDIGGSNGKYAWVLDGATGLQEEQFFDSKSDASWLVNQINNCLHKVTKSNISLTYLMRQVSRIVLSESNKKHSLTNIPPYALPSYALAIIKVIDNKLKYLILGDCYLVILNNDKITIITDDAFKRNSLENRLYIGSLVYNKNKLIKTRRSNMNKVGGYNIGSIDGIVFERIQDSEIEVNEGTKIILCTDGFARAVEQYNIYNWNSIFKIPLDEVAKKIRKEENENRFSYTFKKSDDLFALKVSI